MLNAVPPRTSAIILSAFSAAASIAALVSSICGLDGVSILVRLVLEFSVDVTEAVVIGVQIGGVRVIIIVQLPVSIGEGLALDSGIFIGQDGLGQKFL